MVFTTYEEIVELLGRLLITGVVGSMVRCCRVLNEMHGTLRMALDTWHGKAKRAEHGVQSALGEKSWGLHCREGVMVSGLTIAMSLVFIL